MKKYAKVISVILVALMFVGISLDLAEAKTKVWTMYYPSNLNIVYTKLNSSPDDLYYIEVNGNQNGEWVTYFVTFMQMMGRWSMPDKIQYVKWNKDYIELKK